MSKSDRAWKEWGLQNPYYGVLSHDEFRKENLSKENLQRFFATGNEHIDHVMSVLTQQIDPAFRPRLAVDYGCGTGRLTIPLARYAEQTIGIDVSPAMLAEARKNFARLGASNAEAYEMEPGLQAARGADLIHSFIVFQHIDVTTGLSIFDRLVDGLAPRGCIALHFTFGRQASRLRRFVFWARHHIPLAHALAQLLLRRPIKDAPMQMNHYPLDRLLISLRRAGIHNVYLEATDHQGFLGVIIYGQKRLHD